MKSDLVGRLTFDELKTSTLYIDRRAGIVILTSDNVSSEGMVIHSVNNSQMPVGAFVNANAGGGKKYFEVLGGKIELSNF